MKDAPVTRKRLSTMSYWLGLFAMLMIHVGPLYSAVQAAQPSPHHQHAGPESSAYGHHGAAAAADPAWLSALELCGYCELLTANPPLSLAVQLILPRHQPVFFQTLPEQLLPVAPRRSSGNPRAPPSSHC